MAPYFQTYNPSTPQRISEPPPAHYVFLSPYLYHHGGPNVKLFLNGLVSSSILVFKQLLKPVGLAKYTTCGQHCSHKV